VTAATLKAAINPTSQRRWSSSTDAQGREGRTPFLLQRPHRRGRPRRRVGFGFGKANEVSEAIRKASDSARKSLVKVAVRDNTIPHEVIGEYGGGRVLLKPASPGTGVIAGGGVRAVIEAAGIRDVLAKSLGSSNHANVVKATITALQQLRLRDEIYKVRGKIVPAAETAAQTAALAGV